MTGHDVFTLLKAHYEETGKVMSQTSFNAHIGHTTSFEAILNGIGRFEVYLDSKRQAFS